ncbi:MAG TPA: hypothetical protein VFQ45_02290 [Longimicrobium sp.]|nr:hypothetical protein [Longimicrobium sp.]
MPYTAEKPSRALPSDELRARIPGWGVDLDPADRPAFPKERFDLTATGAHWDFPERQVERWPREKSPEHGMLPPVFGTACPPKGLSGVIRKYAYTLSEGRTSHWLLLVAADRVDVLESTIGSALRGRPDNLLAERGLKAELTRHPVRSRVGRHRADLKHQVVDYAMLAAPWVLAGYAAFRAGKAIAAGMEREPEYEWEPAR